MSITSPDTIFKLPPKYIYKIASSTPTPLPPTSDPSSAILPVSSLDSSSGYIHMSTASQISGTLRLFFATSADERDEIWLLRVRGDGFGDEELRWESPDGTVKENRDGEGLFPHLYLGAEGGGERLWLRRDEIVDVRCLVSPVGMTGWETGIDEVVREGWLV